MPCAQQVARVQGQVCAQHPTLANPTRPQGLANGGHPFPDAPHPPPERPNLAGEFLGRRQSWARRQSYPPIPPAASARLGGDRKSRSVDIHDYPLPPLLHVRGAVPPKERRGLALGIHERGMKISIVNGGCVTVNPGGGLAEDKCVRRQLKESSKEGAHRLLPVYPERVESSKNLGIIVEQGANGLDIAGVEG